MADWFDQNAPSADWFGHNQPQQQQPPAQQPESFWQGAWRNLNPMPILKAINDAGNDAQNEHPVAAALLGPGVTAYELGKRVLPGIIQGAKDQWQKASDAYQAGDYSGAAGHALASALPVIGPTAAHAGETIASGNLAGGLGEAAGLLAPFGASAVGSTIRAGAESAGIPGKLTEAAEQQYSSALNATTKGNKARSAEIVPQLIQRGVTGSVKSIQQQAAGHLQELGQALDDAYENLPAGSSIPLKDVQEKITKAANDAFTVPAKSGAVSPGPLADAGTNHAIELNQRLLAASELDENGNRVIPVETARALRQYYDGVVKNAGGYDAKTLADSSTAAAHKMAADAIRSQLASDFPDIAKINKEYSFWKDVDRVTSDTLLRRQGQASTPLSRQIGRGAGAVVGGQVGGVPGSLLGGAIGSRITGMLNSGIMKTTSAVMKDRIANALAEGNPPAAEFYLRQAMRAAPIGQTMATAPGAALPVAAGPNQQPGQ